MILPGILEIDFEEIKKKVSMVQDFAKLVQIDVADGDLVDGKTFQHIEKLDGIDANCVFELHLMVRNPSQYIKKKLTKVSHVIAHVEANDVYDFIAQAKSLGYKVGLCINVSTPLEKLTPYIKNIDYVQFMGVTPGGQGRSFNKDVLPRIREFKSRFPHIRTQIDGGIGKLQLGLVLKAGIDDIVIGSAIFNSENPSETVKMLQEQIEGFA